MPKVTKLLRGRTEDKLRCNSTADMPATAFESIWARYNFKSKLPGVLTWHQTLGNGGVDNLAPSEKKQGAWNWQLQ